MRVCCTAGISLFYYIEVRELFRVTNHIYHPYVTPLTVPIKELRFHNILPAITENAVRGLALRYSLI